MTEMIPADLYEGLEPEEVKARLHESLSFKLQRSLADAPDLVAWIRQTLYPSDGRGERGEVFAAWSSPLRTGVVDDGDRIYALLVSWVWAWADIIGVTRPRDLPRAWRSGRSVDDSDIEGFRAGTSPEDAYSLTFGLARWLLENHERIAAWSLSDEYFAEMLTVLQSAHGRYPRDEGKPRPRIRERRPCPVCGEQQIVAIWYTGSLADVQVRCEHCHADTEEIRAELGVPRSRLAALFRDMETDTPVRLEECPDCGQRAPAEPGVLIDHKPTCRFNPTARRKAS